MKFEVKAGDYLYNRSFPNGYKYLIIQVTSITVVYMRVGWPMSLGYNDLLDTYTSFFNTEFKRFEKV